MYDDRRVAIHRQRRLNEETRAIITSQIMRPATQALLLRLLDLPLTWQISVRHVVNLGVYGGRDAVRRMFREMMLAGHMTCEPERRPDGTFERGIYMVSAEPRWFGQAIEADAEELLTGDAEIGGGKAVEPGPVNQSLDIYNSISNPDTDTGRQCGKVTQSCQHQKAERPQADAKSQLTGKAESRKGATGHLSEAEQPQAAANGLAKREGANSERSRSYRKTGDVRNIERLRGALIAAGGKALADPRQTPGLWRLTEITVWMMAGYSVEADILPAIRDVVGRHGLEPGQVRSWRYFSAAIREAHARRTGEALADARPNYNDPYRDPYAPVARESDTWQSVFVAAATGRG